MYCPDLHARLEKLDQVLDSPNADDALVDPNTDICIPDEDDSNDDEWHDAVDLPHEEVTTDATESGLQPERRSIRIRRPTIRFSVPSNARTAPATVSYDHTAERLAPATGSFDHTAERQSDPETDECSVEASPTDNNCALFTILSSQQRSKKKSKSSGKSHSERMPDAQWKLSLI